MPSGLTIDELRLRRLQFIYRLYELTEGNEYAYVNMFDLGKELGLDKDLSSSITQYLRGESLLAYKAIGGIIGITHGGVVEVEEALSNPARPTEHFPAFNVIYVGHMVNSQIQQAMGPGAAQTINMSGDRLEEIRRVLQEIQQSMRSLDLKQGEMQDLEASIETLSAQLKSTRPKQSIVAECLQSIRKILEGAAGNVVGQVLLGRILAIMATG